MPPQDSDPQARPVTVYDLEALEARTNAAMARSESRTNDRLLAIETAMKAKGTQYLTIFLVIGTWATALANHVKLG